MPHDSAARGVTALVTAKEAYPAFEALFLSAKNSIGLGFRIFDPLTKLRSDEAQKIGGTWADLIVATLDRGVQIDLTLSDFDPVVAYDLHCASWRSFGILDGLNAKTKPGAAQLTLKCVLHPAQGGIVPRLLFAPKTRKKLHEIAAQMNEKPDLESALSDAPGLAGMLQIKGGAIGPRPWIVPPLRPVTLHHKMAVFDGQITYIGGLDLNERRFDDQQHNQPAQSTWHDVQLIVRDKAIARDAAIVLQALPDVISGHAAPPKITSAFRITLSKKRRWDTFSLSPRNVVDGLLHEHLQQIKSARKLIYLETQFFRDRRIASALARAGRANPDLKLLLLLPAAPQKIAFDGASGMDARYGEYLQARAIARVRRAFGDRFLAVSPVQPRQPDTQDSGSSRATLAKAPIIYVHAKVAVFDEGAAIVSSANLNGRSMKWDSEAGVAITLPQEVAAIRDSVFRHWLPQSAGPEFYDPNTAFDQWARLAMANADLPPTAREGFIVPYDLAPAKDLAQTIPGAPEEIV